MTFPSVAFVFLTALPLALETLDSRSRHSSDPIVGFEVGQLRGTGYDNDSEKRVLET